MLTGNKYNVYTWGHLNTLKITFREDRINLLFLFIILEGQLNIAS